ncbi:hypothetical protein AVEN_246839-1 [Araneus ventricosus]|uniref:Uncharacterized protein n=1 Tax=Araneus ventricosus TaxID=182803 RepID=A0A4Y2UVM4_ARAVE|nr:hypothetical protein AVEN_246839-1 [Araneus ventricosus]
MQSVCDDRQIQIPQEYPTTTTCEVQSPVHLLSKDRFVDDFETGTMACANEKKPPEAIISNKDCCELEIICHVDRNGNQ